MCRKRRLVFVDLVKINAIAHVGILQDVEAVTTGLVAHGPLRIQPRRYRPRGPRSRRRSVTWRGKKSMKPIAPLVTAAT